MSDIWIDGRKWEPITESDRQAYADEIERAEQCGTLKSMDRLDLVISGLRYLASESESGGWDEECTLKDVLSMTALVDDLLAR